MLERFRRAISLESHDLVTTVVRHGRGDLDLASLAEPLELLCRDLDGPAGLHLSGRRAARRWLLDRVAASPPAHLGRARPDGDDATGGGAAAIAVVGLPGSGADDLARRLSHATSLDSTEERERRLRALDLECRWHLPSWAEWFDGTPHDDTWAAMVDATRSAGGTRWWTSWQMLERLDELERATGGRLVAVLVDLPVAEAVDPFVESVVTERRRWSDAVDPASVARYWTWRLDRLAQRGDEWAATTTAPVVRLDAAELRRDPDRAVALARSVTGA